MLNRRTLLTALTLTGVSTPLLASRDDYASSQMANDWMQSWIKTSTVADPQSRKGPNGALHLGRFADPIYFLIGPAGWTPEAHQAATYSPVRVPIGFVTDFASIPRVFWTLIPPDSRYSYAAIVHDYLYWEQYLSRETSDNIFKFLMEDFKINTVTVNAIYSAVRLAGGFAWEENGRLKRAGEKRVLQKFPEDPRIDWSTWKRRSDVFI